MHYLLRTTGDKAGPAFWMASRILAPATVATLPKWMRTLGGFDQPAAVDAATTRIGRAAVRAAANPALSDAILRRFAPATAEVLRAHRSAGQPALAETITPARAHELYGYTNSPRQDLATTSQ
jgi:hypothetical protein